MKSLNIRVAVVPHGRRGREMFGTGQRTRKLLAAAAATCAALTIVATPGPAAASASAWCQSSYLVYKYWKSDGTIGRWSQNCAGDHSLNSKGYKLEPGGWSGYIDYSDGTWDYFCDFQDKWLGKRVVNITMAAAKIEYCVK
ncbi:hypothetical protein AB0C33_47050 [Nonomuraea sp. NPDC048881]|uniref:hypothetical protein n=1 Tax=Nonomuraea sp. NPDC048881 TaxID=3155030 RepID=UPI0033F86B86